MLARGLFSVGFTFSAVVVLLNSVEPRLAV
jgi:hypothetical protein